MKNITATILATAILLSLAACGENNDTPATTTVTTTVTEETTEMTTTETVTEEATLPEFDINSEECLMYRLLDMTVEEIVDEFGEDKMISAGISDYGKYYDLYPYADNKSVKVGYALISENFEGDSWEVSSNAIPEFVSIMYPSYNIYPGINADMTASDVAGIVPYWDEVNLNGTNIIDTILYIDNYTLNVSWKLGDEFRGRIEADINGKSEDEVKVIKQKYADEFVENTITNSSKIMSVLINRKEKQ